MNRFQLADVAGCSSYCFGRMRIGQGRSGQSFNVFRGHEWAAVKVERGLVELHSVVVCMYVYEVHLGLR